MRRPDLHLHTTASDGIYAPAQVAYLAQKADITFFSVTDHDTVDGIPEASKAANERGIAFVPGVEISTEGDAEVHVLGYGVDAQSPRLAAFFQQMAQERVDRARKMARKLDVLGHPVDIEEIIAKAGSSVGRPHLARALMQDGVVGSVQEAFEKYLGSRCPAYVPRERLAASEAIALLRREGAVPVLAHPALIPWPMERLLPLIKAWQEAGLMGIEVYHPANSAIYPSLDRLARQRGLLVTGGSDFHDGVGHGQIGETITAWPTACEDAWALYSAVRQDKN